MDFLQYNNEMTNETLQKYKDALLKEKETLRTELEGRGRKISDEGSPDWIATPDEDFATSADPNENADDVDDFEANIAVVSELEEQYNQVLAAIKRIEEGTYGMCKECGEEIEEARLDAIPTAKTCRKHLSVK